MEVSTFAPCHVVFQSMKRRQCSCKKLFAQQSCFNVPSAIGGAARCLSSHLTRTVWLCEICSHTCTRTLLTLLYSRKTFPWHLLGSVSRCIPIHPSYDSVGHRRRVVRRRLDGFHAIKENIVKGPSPWGARHICSKVVQLKTTLLGKVTCCLVANDFPFSRRPARDARPLENNVFNPTDL